jgi:hypothetical protein
MRWQPVASQAGDDVAEQERRTPDRHRANAVDDPIRHITVVILAQRGANETGMPAVCEGVLTAARTI